MNREILYHSAIQHERREILEFAKVSVEASDEESRRDGHMVAPDAIRGSDGS